MIVVLLAASFGCCVSWHDEYLIPEETSNISGRTFSQPVLIYGAKYDGLVVDNCTFENIKGSAITIRTASNVTVRNCTFRNIKGNGVVLEGGEPASGNTVQNSTFSSIWGNGISVKEEQSAVTLSGNTITKSGIDLVCAARGMPHHGIYMMGSLFIIEGNVIDTVVNRGGNGISARSNGIIRRNLVSGTTKAGIDYYCDHPSSGWLLIENNIVYDTGRYGVAILSDGTVAHHINGATIRFNSVITEASASVKLDSGIADIPIEIYGNIFIRTDGSVQFIYDRGGDAAIQVNSANLTGSGDVGFVDFSNRNFHITAGSAAGLFDVGPVPQYPVFDFDGDMRADGSQYVGADDPD